MEPSLVRVTAWVDKNKIGRLIKKTGKKYSQSEILRVLVDQEIERIASQEAHERLYGVARERDFDDRFL